MKHISSAARLSACAATLSLVGVLAATTPAVAGSNGQHVTACSGRFDTAGAEVWGTDQNGNFANTPRRNFNAKAADAGPYSPASTQGGCINFGDYWFKGNVTVRWYLKSGGPTEEHYYVPVSQSGDWVTLNQ